MEGVLRCGRVKSNGGYWVSDHFLGQLLMGTVGRKVHRHIIRRLANMEQLG